MTKKYTKVRKFKSKEEPHSESVNRLRRAYGHLASVIYMVESDRPCGDVLQQLSAVISALGGSRVQILKAHLNSCLKPVLSSKHGKLVKEIEDAIQRAMKV